MALDGFVVRAVTFELQACKGGKINKIYQPTNQDIVMHIRAGGQSYRLLLSASPTYPRLHVTERSYMNPVEAPMFCMLLRKHCENAIIEDIRQVGNERIVYIDVRQRDELGDISVKRIVLEIMGRHSNLILLDPHTGTVLDGIHHITPAISSHRVILPGVRYVEPPEQHKREPFDAAETDIAELLQTAGAVDEESAAAALVEGYTGVSPLAARAVAFAGIQAAAPGTPVPFAVAASFIQLLEDLRKHRYYPHIKELGNKGKLVFSVLPLPHLSGTVSAQFQSVSECLEQFYGDKSERDVIKQRTLDLTRFLQNEIDKNVKKLAKLDESLEDALDADRYRKLGELLTASLHSISRGDKEAVVIDYYEEEQPELVIPLDPLLSPAENAQRYFRRYNKMKSSIAHVEEQMLQAKQETAYFQALQQQLQDALMSDIDEIREELVEGGYLRDRGKKQKKKRKDSKPSVLCFTSSEGIPIYVGKNNTQNDYVSMKLAGPGDTWLHVKDMPGSHVLIRGGSYSDATLEEAAILAAYYSSGKQSSLVPVDFTLARHVRKPSGSKPGFVIYDHQKTLFVTPDESRIKVLKQEIR